MPTYVVGILVTQPYAVTVNATDFHQAHHKALEQVHAGEVRPVSTEVKLLDVQIVLREQPEPDQP